MSYGFEAALELRELLEKASALEGRVVELEAEVERLRVREVNAERYEWLRKFHGRKRSEATVVFWGDEPWEPGDADELDKAIDAARGAKP